MTQWLDTEILSSGLFSLTWRNVMSFLIFQIILLILYRMIVYKLLAFYKESNRLNDSNFKTIGKKVGTIYIVLALIATVKILHLDINLLQGTPFNIPVSFLFIILLFIFIARLLDFIINMVFLQEIYRKKEKEMLKQGDKRSLRRTPNSSIQYAVYLIFIIWALQYFNLDFKVLPTIQMDENVINFYFSNILFGVLIIIIARLLGWGITQIILFTYYKRREIDTGTQFAINQLIKYTIYVLAFIIALESFGINLTVLWGGAAALLVGVGLGMQQTFNDFVSGIILLFERSVEVGDVVEIENTVGVVQKIGLRSSRVETRDNINVIVPNSKLIINNMVNWSHYDDKVRFLLPVGVAYGSDTKRVKQVLIDVAKNSPYVLEYPGPTVLFREFADSSLNFDLIFWSRNFMLIESIKSDLRFEIDMAFRDNDIVIPFPQRDLWFKSAESQDGVEHGKDKIQGNISQAEKDDQK